jgi:hypothetical protein
MTDFPRFASPVVNDDRNPRENAAQRHPPDRMVIVAPV